MPELPEVETVRRGLAPAMEGRKIKRFEARRADLRRALPPDMKQRLEGRKILKVARRAKYLILHLDHGLALVMHLGMSGKFLVRDDTYKPGAHDHLVFKLTGGSAIVFNDARRFGHADLVAETALGDYPGLQDLGPEPLEESFTGKTLTGAFKNKKVAVKVALMDQRLVAGLGNIYAAEALWRAHLSPKRAAGKVSGADATRLAAGIKSVLRASIEAGGSSLRDYVRADGELGCFQHSFAVYGRAGEPCLTRGCGGTIKQMTQGGRSTFYCPKCQR
jgi:formamidopyrimidine-DNA glycosylase